MNDSEKQVSTTVITGQDQRGRALSAFSSVNAFEDAQRMAKAMASTELVPKTYQGNVANCLIAIEMGQRTGMSPIFVAQSLYVVHGNPSWSSKFIIGAINACGRFRPLKFKKSGAGDQRECIAYAVEHDGGEVLEGPPVTIAMAKSEGWYGRTGSKWPTMPELMLMYRAAAFFGRLYCPEILLGMNTDDEVREITEVPSEVVQAPAAAAAKLNEKVRAATKPPVVLPPEDDARPIHTNDIRADIEHAKQNGIPVNGSDGGHF